MPRRLDMRDAPEDRKPPRNGDEWCPKCKRYGEAVLADYSETYDETNERCSLCNTVIFKVSKT